MKLLTKTIYTLLFFAFVGGASLKGAEVVTSKDLLKKFLINDGYDPESIKQVLTVHKNLINIVDQELNPLVVALSKGDFSLVEWLIDNGADVNLIVPPLGNIKRHFSSLGTMWRIYSDNRSKHEKMVEMLEKRPLKYSNHLKELLTVDGYNAESIKKLLLVHKWLMNLNKYSYENPLAVAVLHGDTDLAAWLVSNGANPEIGLEDGWNSITNYLKSLSTRLQLYKDDQVRYKKMLNILEKKPF
jgi:hypothetical protein